MITLKSKREIQTLQAAADVVKEIFKTVKAMVAPGVTTEELNRAAEKVISEHHAEPAFKGYRGYPKTACISINEEVVHGIPGKRKLLSGDLVSFDIGVKLNGYYADAARTWAVGEISRMHQSLMETAEQALLRALANYQPGWHIGDLSSAIQRFVEARGFQVVREYVGHGIGKSIHEEPQVPNYGTPGYGPKIEPGLVLAVEPMVTEGRHTVEVLKDGWTVVTKDRKFASHYEDMVAFTENGFINLTSCESE